jgi:adenylate cyclase
MVSASLQLEGRAGPPDTGGAPTRDALTMLFGDIEGSTALAERLGDAAWLEVLRTHRATVASVVAAAGAGDLRTWGDGFLAVFPSVDAGLEGATRLHRELRRGPLPVRLGLHAGIVHRQDGDVVGLDVHVAARVAAQARGGELLLSSTVRPAAARRPDLAVGPPRAAVLPGLAEPRDLYAVDPR